MPAIIDDIDDLINKVNSSIDESQTQTEIDDTDTQIEISEDQANGNGRASKSKKSSIRSQSVSDIKKKDQDKEKEKKPRSTAYKYSKNGKIPLRESAILAGRPVFLTYENGKIQPHGIIEEDIRIVEPPHPQNYPYLPYEFENMEEVLRYRDRALNENIDSLYLKAKQIASDYNDQRIEKINLLAIEIISSYFQDRFPTIHYDIVTGGNGSGKSTYGDTFTSTGYRVVNLTDPNAANINRILGSIEIGQCTIVSDETGAIEKQPDLLSLLKTGYSPTGKTSKINDYSRAPEYFYTYCFKMIISERMPNLRDARGVVDRSFSFTTYKGLPKYDIKETLEPQRNRARQERLDRLIDFRKLMLVYRLIHFKDELPDIYIGVEGREKELSKPIIQLFYNTNAQKEIESTLQYFLDTKSEKKEITLEPILHPIVTNLVSRDGNEVSNKAIWEEIKNIIDGHYDEKKPYEYHTLEYGTIYNNTISNILEHTFGGRPKHRSFGNTFIFDPEELVRVGNAYNLTTKIQTKVIAENNTIEQEYRTKDEGSEGCEGYRESFVGSNDGDKVTGNTAISEGIEALDKDEKGQCELDRPSIEPSMPSQPSHIDLEDSSTIAEHDLYWIESLGLWGCNICSLKADKFGMENTPCKRNKKRRV
jgi:hypothetical protein